jgi:hypothetical protein
MSDLLFGAKDEPSNIDWNEVDFEAYKGPNEDEEEPDATPVQDYWYPFQESVRFEEIDVEQACFNIRHLSLSLVYVADLDCWGLALTGGGMDLSWQIAEAFVRMGFYPPNFIDRLLDYPGKRTEGQMFVLDALHARDQFRVNRLSQQINDWETFIIEAQEGTS